MRALRPRYVAIALLLLVLIGGAALYLRGNQGGIAGHQRPNHGSSTNHTAATGDATRQVVKEPAGVLEKVVVSDADNSTSIERVQQQLSAKAERYRAGDFVDPSVHGEISPEMRGLQQLKAGAARIQVAYQALPNGAQIRLSSTDPNLVDLLHLWSDMQ